LEDSKRVALLPWWTNETPEVIFDLLCGAKLWYEAIKSRPYTCILQQQNTRFLNPEIQLDATLAFGTLKAAYFTAMSMRCPWLFVCEFTLLISWAALASKIKASVIE